jgi:hypothetical protein
MLTTIGEACRAVKGELLAQLVDWIVDKDSTTYYPCRQLTR